MNKPRILFLYTELADYTLACMANACSRFSVHVVHWPVNEEAPFQLREIAGLSTIPKSRFKGRTELAGFVHELKPEVIFVSGWVDKVYLRVLRNLNFRTKKVIMMDTAWSNTWKQRVTLPVAKILVSRLFDFAFVTGSRQKTYARRLGIPANRIFTGLYAADTYRFNETYHKRKGTVAPKNPKRILYVGRYVKHKGIFELWQAFSELADEQFKDWELWCAGTGDQWDNRVEHPNIRHFGFVQPAEMEGLLLQASIYVLPSHFEPWGVSVHEMAAAGFPMLLSDKVGAAEAFLEAGLNGDVFSAGNQQQLKQKLRGMMAMSGEQLLAMGEKSHQLARKITPETWTETLDEIVKA